MTAAPSPIPDLLHDLARAIPGGIRADPATRILYSTDASLYQIEPLGVVFPRTGDDLLAAVELAARYRVPVLARGAGSSLAGQAVGAALVLDCSRHLDRILHLDPEARTATVEPGVVVDALNAAAAPFGLQLGPDPASAERATLGGSLANNASGAHSICYGMFADHILSAEVVFGDGSPARLEGMTLAEAEALARTPTALGRLTRAALDIRRDHAATIRARWPQTWRRASGYALNYLLPWSPTRPPEWPADQPYPRLGAPFSLAPLLAGSEGTLAVIRQATVNLVPSPAHTLLAVLAYESVAAACDDVPRLLALHPSAVELIPGLLLDLARSVPAYAPLASFVDGTPPALLVVEFSVEFAGDAAQSLRDQAASLGPRALLVEGLSQQKQIWAVRKVGLGLIMSRPGDSRPGPFIEDISVPVERLGEFIREMERLLAAYSEAPQEVVVYAHASAGCLHMRPILNLKTLAGRQAMRALAEEAVGLAIRLGGSVSGEHGDGLARSEWLPRLFGEDILGLFGHLKVAADPEGILNPGKILHPQKMDDNLRVSRVPGGTAPAFNPLTSFWQPVMSFESQYSLPLAIEQCNGAGVCRKMDGLMCPSFQATREEMHATRGRANLLRAMVSGTLPDRAEAAEFAFEALDLCLECKGCKAECPSAVDMAKLKYEFLHHYYAPGGLGRRRPLRDHFFARIGELARLGRPFAPLANAVLRSPTARRLGEGWLGISAARLLPQVAGQTFHQLARRSRQARPEGARQARPEGRRRSGDRGTETGRVLFLADPFTEYFYPQVGLAGVRLLEAAGFGVDIVPVTGAGRTLISRGFLDEAQAHARRLLDALERLDPEGDLPIVGVEPSDLYTLWDEFPDLLAADERVVGVAARAFLVDEFLVRPGPEGTVRAAGIPFRAAEPRLVYLHGHCYQKARPPAGDGFPVGAAATRALLEMAGCETMEIESGCCGMAGSFGYEAGHHALSLQIGEMALFPAVRNAPEGAVIAAPGVSCRAQIAGSTGRGAIHPLELLASHVGQAF